MGEEAESETQDTVDTLPVPKPEEAKKEGKGSFYSKEVVTFIEYE